MCEFAGPWRVLRDRHSAVSRIDGSRNGRRGTPSGSRMSLRCMAVALQVVLEALRGVRALPALVLRCSDLGGGEAQSRAGGARRRTSRTASEIEGVRFENPFARLTGSCDALTPDTPPAVDLLHSTMLECSPHLGPTRAGGWIAHSGREGRGRAVAQPPLRCPPPGRAETAPEAGRPRTGIPGMRFRFSAHRPTRRRRLVVPRMPPRPIRRRGFCCFR